MPAPRLAPPPAQELPTLPAATVLRGGARVVTESAAEDLSADEYAVVDELSDRVSTRLTVEDRNYEPGPRRELTKKLIRDEYDQWLLHQANRGRSAPTTATEDKIFAAVLAELDGLGRLAPLLARGDVEDIHFEGCDPTVLRLKTGELVPGPAIASSDEELVQLLRTIAARSGDGQTSREFSSASPILNIRLKGVTELGARLWAAMDVLPRPAGVIRVHRFSDPTLEDLREPADAKNAPMIDTPIQAFLHYAVLAGASLLVSGNPAVGKTTLLRALLNAVPAQNVLVTVEDERELGTHLPRWDPASRRMVKRHAVCRTIEARLPNAEGRGGFDMGDALNEALRTSATWVAVGEVRGAYVTYLLEAATSGLASVMCTIHSRSADGIFKKVRINALKANPAPDPELVSASLSELDLVIHVSRDDNYNRYVSGIYEMRDGPGDSGNPDLVEIFAIRPGDTRPTSRGPGALSDDLKHRMEAVGFDTKHWLAEDRSDWRAGPRRSERAS